MMRRIKEIFTKNSVIKKITGVIFVLVGIIAIIAPIIPGFWLVFIGFEMLGLRLLLADWIKKRKLKKVINASIDKTI